MNPPDDDSDIPRIDLVEEFGPDHPNVQVNPMFAALSIGMQQMPGSIEGMKNSMEHFMNATDSRYWNRDIDTRAIERMMFEPDERTIDRIISLMETRYDEIEEIEETLLKKHLEELKKRVKAKIAEEEAQKAQKEKEEEETEKEKEKETEEEESGKSLGDPVIEEINETQ